MSPYRTPHVRWMATHWGDSWLYGGLVVAFGWSFRVPGWPPTIRREEARARAALLEEMAR